MRLFYKTILIVSTLLLISTTKYYGQTADLQFVVTQNDQTVSGTYSVKIQIKLTSEADMGTSAIQFTFNSIGLNFPESPVENTDYEYHNFQGFIPGGDPFTNYVSTVTRPVSGKVSINIVLSLGADGQTITTDWVDIVTLSFTILDVNESSNLQWVPGTTTIFDDQNNPFTNGIFTDENTPLPVEVESIPVKYELYQNFPNPFNPITNIKISLPEISQVAIRVYDLLGSMVGEIVNKEFQAGFHKIMFNANQYVSGVYIYRLETKNFTDVKKMMLVK